VQLHADINISSDLCSLIFFGPTNAKIVANCNLGEVKLKTIIVSQWLLPAGMCRVPLVACQGQHNVLLTSAILLAFAVCCGLLLSCSWQIFVDL